MYLISKWVLGAGKSLFVATIAVVGPFIWCWSMQMTKEEKLFYRMKTVAKPAWVQWCHPTPLKKLCTKKLVYIKYKAEQIKCTQLAQR